VGATLLWYSFIILDRPLSIEFCQIGDTEMPFHRRIKL
jgi:hypothetical protein